MTTVRTHYDNLKVARDAPPEVIKAAYKSLAQRYHPDRNPGDKEAERIMQLINSSYNVLSDPDKRAQHDAWIAREEARILQASRPNLTKNTAYSSPGGPMPPFTHSAPRRAPPGYSSLFKKDMIDLVTHFRPIYTFAIVAYFLWATLNSMLPSQSDTRGHSSGELIGPSPSATSSNNAILLNTNNDTQRRHTNHSFADLFKEFEKSTILYSIFSDIAMARKTGMNDDMIYLELMRSQKWKTKLEQWQHSQNLSDEQLVKRMGLNLSTSPENLKQTPPTLTTQNFFDQPPPTQIQKNADLVEAFLNHSSIIKPKPPIKEEPILNEPPGTQNSAAPEATPLYNFFHTSRPYPEEAKKRIDRLKTTGVPDITIYRMLYSDSPFSERMLNALRQGFSDADIAALFNLDINSPPSPQPPSNNNEPITPEASN